jgi:drug/metabolite transporter (DMT)-like permease
MRNFLQLLLLAALWAPSFLLIKIAGEGGVPPVTMATLRVVIGAFFMWLWMRWRGHTIPTDRDTWMRVLPMGLLATAIPFILFTWGEQHTDSGLASILNGTTPIFTVLIAHMVLVDERLNPRKILGVLVGFAGIALTFWPRIGGEAGVDGRIGYISSQTYFGINATVLGLAAFVTASFCYGLSTVYARRRLMGLPPLVGPTIQLILAAIAMVPAAFVLEDPLAVEASKVAIGSIVFLGIVGTAMAYVVFYDLIGKSGATFASLVTYLLPPTGIALGMMVLDEEPGWEAVVGSGLIILGVGIVTAKQRGRRTEA